MRKLLLLSIIASVGLAADAQETYSLSATANQVTDLRQHVLAENRALCRRYSVALASCQTSQGTICAAANAAGGASCTAAQARAAGVRVWPDTQAGREEFVTFSWVAPDFQAARTETPQPFIPGPAMGDYCEWWKAQNQTTKDAECSKISAPTPCVVCL